MFSSILLDLLDPLRTWVLGEDPFKHALSLGTLRAGKLLPPVEGKVLVEEDL